MRTCFFASPGGGTPGQRVHFDYVHATCAAACGGSRGAASSQPFPTAVWVSCHSRSQGHRLVIATREVWYDDAHPHLRSHGHVQGVRQPFGILEPKGFCQHGSERDLCSSWPGPFRPMWSPAPTFFHRPCMFLPRCLPGDRSAYVSTLLAWGPVPLLVSLYLYASSCSPRLREQPVRGVCDPRQEWPVPVLLCAAAWGLAIAWLTWFLTQHAERTS